MRIFHGWVPKSGIESWLFQCSTGVGSLTKWTSWLGLAHPGKDDGKFGERQFGFKCRELDELLRSLNVSAYKICKQIKWMYSEEAHGRRNVSRQQPLRSRPDSVCCERQSGRGSHLRGLPLGHGSDKRCTLSAPILRQHERDITPGGQQAHRLFQDPRETTERKVQAKPTKLTR